MILGKIYTDIYLFKSFTHSYIHTYLKVYNGSQPPPLAPLFLLNLKMNSTHMLLTLCAIIIHIH